MQRKIQYFISGFSLLILLFTSCADKIEKIQPEVNTITESVYASATVQPENLYSVFSSVNGILEDFFVEECSEIKAGDALFQIINNNPKLNAENAKLAYELALENFKGKNAVLESLQKEIDAAKLKFETDSINFFRQSNLWKQNIGSKADYEARKLAYDLSKNNLSILKKNFAQTDSELQNKLQQAENNYKSALTLSSDFTITSKTDGKVYAVYKKPGETVTTMEPIASIGHAENFIIELLIDEVDIIKVQTGNPVIINLDAYRNKAFTGTVSKIYPQKDARNQTFKLEAIFDENPEVLYPGLSGEANVIILERENTMIIPKSYLIDGNKVKTDSGILEVEKGIETTEFVEVLSGIESNTWIYKPAK